MPPPRTDAGELGDAGTDTSPGIDAGGQPDAAADAGGETDSGTGTDTGGGTPDTGRTDSGTPDTGTPDTGTPDTGTPDSGGSTRCYDEPIDPDADISDLVSRYGGSDWKDVLIEVFERRHPATAFLLEEQRDDSYFGMFSDSRNWGRMVEWIDTLSHEQTHLFNAYEAIDRGTTATIFIREDEIYELDSSLEGYPRSEISSMITVLPSGQYARLYFTGWQGERGFRPMLDETNAYLNEMCALAVVGEDYPGAGVSSRDGSVAFLYYLQLYLRRARTNYPDFYAAARANATIRDIVQTLWLRTWFCLPISDRFPGLGISDTTFRETIMIPENLAEIRMFIGEDVGASPCLPE